jgi:hypothetical protein
MKACIVTLTTLLTGVLLHAAESQLITLRLEGGLGVIPTQAVLSNGVPLELVRHVTGHRTVAVVLKHYFRPGCEDFRQALNAAMPQFLTGGQGASAGSGEVPSPKEQLRTIIEQVTPRTWKRDKDRILETISRSRNVWRVQDSIVSAMVRALLCVGISRLTCGRPLMGAECSGFRGGIEGKSHPCSQAAGGVYPAIPQRSGPSG